MSHWVAGQVARLRITMLGNAQHSTFFLGHKAGGYIADNLVISWQFQWLVLHGAIIWMHKRLWHMILWPWHFTYDWCRPCSHFPHSYAVLCIKDEQMLFADKWLHNDAMMCRTMPQMLIMHSPTCCLLISIHKKNMSESKRELIIQQLNFCWLSSQVVISCFVSH